MVIVLNKLEALPHFCGVCELRRMEMKEVGVGSGFTDELKWSCSSSGVKLFR